MPRAHQGVSCTVNMMTCYFWWIGMHRDIHQHSCKLCIQFLPNRIYTQPMHLEIPSVPFAGYAMDCIGPLPMLLKGHRHALTFICLLTSYLITVPLRMKMADEVSMAYIKKILPKPLCSKFILQDNGAEFRNEHLMSVFHSSGIKHIYSNPYYPKGNNRIENIHNFQKCTIMKFTYGSQLEWDNTLPLATYCFNIAAWVDDLESPFYLVHDRDTLEGRLSNLHNYCRYVGDQPGWLAVQELRKMWKLHAKLLKENRSTEPADNRKITKASDLKLGQLVFVKDHWKGTFNPSYVFDHRVGGILNDSTVVLTTPNGKERKCHIHHINPMTAVEASTSALSQFQDSIQKKPEKKPPTSHQYNLHLKTN